MQALCLVLGRPREFRVHLILDSLPNCTQVRAEPRGRPCVSVQYCPCSLLPFRTISRMIREAKKKDVTELLPGRKMWFLSKTKTRRNTNGKTHWCSSNCVSISMKGK